VTIAMVIGKSCKVPVRDVIAHVRSTCVPSRK